MAGGKITRIVGGNNSIECEQWSVYTEKFSAYAENGSYFTADKGTNIGEPKDPPSSGNYFKKAWWSSDYEGTKQITKAKVGDVVYFQVEMTEKFPQNNLSKNQQEKISFKLYEFNGHDYSLGYMYIFAPRIYLDKQPKKDKEVKYLIWEDANENKKVDLEEEYSKKFYNEEKVNGKKAIIAFQLSDGLSEYFNEFAELKLFMSLSYDWETIELPETENLYLDVEPKPPLIKEIYVRLLNYQVSQSSINHLDKVNGSIQYLEGNDNIMSEKVNMDYFSVKIDELPKFANDNIILLYKKIRENFLTLSKGNVSFDSHSEPFHSNVNGRWEFKPYSIEQDPKFEKEQLRRWRNELGSTILFIEAGGGFIEDKIGDSGAVLESETNPYDMCWIFTTIVTQKSETQPFSGHRQFGIHKDEDGCYRFYARAIDRIWPTPTIVNLSMGRKDFAIKDYLTIADSTWNNLINNVSKFIIKNGGKTTIVKPEIVRTDFNKFRDKYKKTPVNFIGNIPQYKEIQEDEI
ncbi:hypothetical protein [Chryseobacterium sp. CBo1]|uniref:hypothetical protein n=1 Tax=Chryseobacterium sp. CBo1 TaxID=1869230 RepID=UPI000F4FC4F8|nr:hypothetical protein [Chryseobacterium sp. CBo1]